MWTNFCISNSKDLGLNAGFLIRYILEKCVTVDQAKKFFEEVEVGSSQNIIVADAKGDVLLAELNSENKYFKIISSRSNQ